MYGGFALLDHSVLDVLNVHKLDFLVPYFKVFGY